MKVSIATDVLIPTYNSDRYLEECYRRTISSIPMIHRLIVADHYSSDSTLNILAKIASELGPERVTILEEDKGLGYARQLLINHSETDIITWIDSDLIITDLNWWIKAFRILEEDNSIGAVVARVNDDRLENPRMKYANFWWRYMPTTRRFGLTLGSTLVRREYLKGLKIPSWLDAREDRYLELHLLRGVSGLSLSS